MHHICETIMDYGSIIGSQEFVIGYITCGVISKLPFHMKYGIIAFLMIIMLLNMLILDTCDYINEEMDYEILLEPLEEEDESNLYPVSTPSPPRPRETVSEKKD